MYRHKEARLLPPYSLPRNQPCHRLPEDVLVNIAPKLELRRHGHEELGKRVVKERNSLLNRKSHSVLVRAHEHVLGKDFVHIKLNNIGHKIHSSFASAAAEIILIYICN